MSASRSTLVTTTSGRLSGLEVDGCCAWLGIPYAQAPLGPLRWRAPKKPIAWNGIRDATKFGPHCPQTISALVNASRPTFSEDCLSLNVWSARATGAHAADAKRRPVLFWIHGGGFVAGGSRMFDGADLARNGDMVVVTINYRLGILGLVNLPGSEGNLGLRDQIAALEWVQGNIEAFGGDPDRVTIAGESAGSVFCSLLLICESARRLFAGAILQSGAQNLLHDEESSRYIAQHYERELPLGQGIDALRKMDVLGLLRAEQSVDRRLPGLVPAAPWFDGDLLPATYEEAQRKRTAKVPLIIGTCRNEHRFFSLVPGWKPIPTKPETIMALIDQQIGAGEGAKIRATYAPSTRGDRDLGTDATFRAGAWQLAARHTAQGERPTWMYRFDAGFPGLGALHGIDVTYLWATKNPIASLFRGGFLVGDRAALARRLRAHWTQFVREGNPGSDWPALDDSFPTKIFDRHGSQDQVARDPDAASRAAWNNRAILPARYRPTI